MKIKEVKEFLHKLLNHKCPPPVFLWGPPGIGKSSLVKQVAEERGIELLDLRLSLLEPVDLRGIPSVNGDKCFWTRPPFIPEEGDGILFLDELNTASPSVQNSALQLVLDRKIGEHKLGDGWYIIAAGNRREDMAHTFKLSTPLISRFINIEVNCEIEEWVGYAIKKGLSEEIISFIQFRPELLLQLPQTSDTPFPCPRTWEYLSQVLPLTDNMDVWKGIVGEGAAYEFSSFIKIYKKIPDIQQILEGKKIYPDMKETSLLIATVVGVAKRAQPSHVSNVLSWTLELEEKMAVLCVHLLLQKGDGYRESFYNSPVRNKWINKFGGFIL
jgi:hypothetical protein